MRVVIRLRALVILPTRDLVVQVRETFEAISKGRGLKVSAICLCNTMRNKSISDWDCYRTALVCARAIPTYRGPVAPVRTKTFIHMVLILFC
jgi:hypothetical protein